MTKQFTSLLLILVFFSFVASAQSRLVDREALMSSLPIIYSVLSEEARVVSRFVVE